MAITEELRVVVKAEVDKAVGEMRKFDKQMGASEKKTLSFGQIASGAMGLGAVVMVARKAAQAIGDMMDFYAVQEQAEAKLAQAIISTGGAAGVSAGELKSMASALQKVTTYGDETIIGAQSMLLTFTKVGKEVFPQATEAILNMATAMGQDLRSVTIQVGKALNDPLLGVTALGRAGVQFTEDQKAMIKSLVDTNDLAGAQGLILKELETQFGGVARAMGDTASGAATQFQNALGDVKEVLGGVFSEGIKPVLQGLTDMLTKIVEARDVLVDYNAMIAGTSVYESIEETTAALGALDLQIADSYERMKLLENETSRAGMERYEAAKKQWEDERTARERISAAHMAFWMAGRKQSDAEIQAAETRRRQEEFALRLAEAYAKTTEGQTEELEQQIRYWETLTDVEGVQLEQVEAVLVMLREQKAALEGSADAAEAITDWMEKIYAWEAKAAREAEVLSRRFTDSHNSLRRMTEEHQRFNDETEDAIGLATALHQEWDEVAESVGKAANTTTDTAGAAEDLEGTLDEVNRNLEEINRQMNEMYDRLDDAGQKWIDEQIQRYMDAMEAYGSEWEWMWAEAIQQAKDAAREITAAMDEAMGNIDDTYGEELYLLQHLLDEGQIGIDEYLRRLNVLKDWREAAEADVTATGEAAMPDVDTGPGDTMHVDENGDPIINPYLDDTTVPDFTTPAGPVYNITIIAPTGDGEAIARTTINAITTLDRRRRL